MNLKYYEIKNFLEFYEKIKDSRLPFRTAYKLAKINSLLTLEHNFFQEELIKLINEYGQRDEKGNLVPTEDGVGVKILKDKESECQMRVGELNELTVSVDAPVLSPEELDGLDLTLEEAQVFLAFIEE